MGKARHAFIHASVESGQLDGSLATFNNGGMIGQSIPEKWRWVKPDDWIIVDQPLSDQIRSRSRSCRRLVIKGVFIVSAINRSQRTVLKCTSTSPTSALRGRACYINV